MKLRDIADRLQCRLEGDGDIDIVRVAGIDQAEGGDLTFVANRRYRSLLSHTRASAVILGDDDADRRERVPCAVLRSANPYLSFARALWLFVDDEPEAAGVHPSAIVAPDAALGPGVSVGPYAIVGAGASIGARTILRAHVVVGAGARIGDDCLLHARVSLRERVVVGSRVVIQDGAVVGSDGFGFVKQEDGTHLKIPQRADVVIEDDVEIGANTTIDRPAVGETRIAAGAKIDNLVQIAHGVRVGQRALLAAQVGIAGSTVIEDDVMLGGQVGVTGHVRVGKRVMASAKTGITGHLDDDAFVSGYPSLPNLEWRKTQVLVRHLPEFKKRIADLEQRLAELEEKIAECRTPSGRS